jgi:acyl carrier protein
MSSFLSSVWRWVNKPDGMDLVELVYRVEEEFELTMSDEDAERIYTPGQLIDYLMERPEVSPKWSRDYVALSVWTMVEDELGVDRNDFNEDSRFIEDMGVD